MAGDRQAYESLMRAHTEYILVSVNALVSDERDAEEIAQDILVLVYRKIGELSSPYAFSAWLRRIIVNTCLNYDKRAARTRRRRETDEAQADDPAAGEAGTPDEALEKKDARDRLYDMIRLLPPMQRRCIFLHYYEDLSYREIARLLGVHIGSVSYGISAAKKNLRKAMETSKEFDSNGRLMEGVAFGYAVKDAIGHNSGKLLTEGAIEKMYGKIATVDSLNISSMGQAVQTHVGTSSARAAWIAGGAAAACVALLFWHQPAPEPAQEQAPDVSAPTVTTIMNDTQYRADAAVISFETDGPPDGVDDPTAASIAVNDDEGTPTVWSIKSGSGAEAASGSGSEADIPSSLAPGRYVITWDVVGDGDAVSVVSREFYVN
jgi:RNA polymerase sigma-70 factor (ECF subfamily)